MYLESVWALSDNAVCFVPKPVFANPGSVLMWKHEAIQFSLLPAARPCPDGCLRKKEKMCGGCAGDTGNNVHLCVFPIVSALLVTWRLLRDSYLKL